VAVLESKRQKIEKKATKAAAPPAKKAKAAPKKSNKK
jgi:hypothetical protein